MFCEFSISVEEHWICKSCRVSLFSDSDRFENSEISDLLHGECLIEEFRFFKFVRLDTADEMSITASEFLHERLHLISEFSAKIFLSFSVAFLLIRLIFRAVPYVLDNIWVRCRKKGMKGIWYFIFIFYSKASYCVFYVFSSVSNGKELSACSWFSED